MRGQILSMDLILSIFGIVMIVGFIYFVLSSSDISPVRERQLFLMRAHEVSRLLFSSDPIVGVLDQQGYLRTDDISAISSKIGILERRYRLNLTISIVPSTGVSTSTIGSCPPDSTRKISFHRYVMNRSGQQLYNISLIICD
ncbi:MAG: hypothetical protein QXD03_00040 [Candidatus Anstonellales archaeon]